MAGRGGLGISAAAADCNGWALLGMDGIDGGIEKIGLSVDGCEVEEGSGQQRAEKLSSLHLLLFSPASLFLFRSVSSSVQI